MKDNSIPKKISVFYGGVSGEKAICELEGKSMIEFLKKNGHEVYPIHVDKTMSFLNKLDKVPKCAILCLTEDLGIQWILDRHGIFYQGSGPLTTMLSMDKVLVKRIIESLGFSTAKDRIIRISDPLDISNISLNYPLIVKPVRSGSSHGLSFVSNEEELRLAIQKAFKDDSQILIEEFIKGIEVTIVGLGEEIVGVVELDKKKSVYSYARKLRGHVEAIEPARIVPEALAQIKKLVKEAVRTLGLRNIYRIDAIVKGGEVYFLEVNTLPYIAEGSECYEAVRNKGLTMYVFLCKIVSDFLQAKNKRVLD